MPKTKRLDLKRLFFLIVATGFTLQTTVASAQTDVYRTLQAPFYDPVSTSCTTTLVGSNEAEQAWNYFKSKGLSDIQTAAILGNFKEESGINPKAVQGNPPYESDTVVPGRGYGIAQWTDRGRQLNLISFAASTKRPVSSLDLQLDFAYREMTDTSPNDIWDTLKTIDNIRDATLYFHKAFERSADDEKKRLERVRAAIRFNNLYGADKLADPEPGEPICDAGPGQACTTGSILGWQLTGECRMVSYDQGDPRWANLAYGRGKSPLAESGCGPTSLAMIGATLLNNTTITPATVANKYGDKYHVSEGTSWGLFPVYAQDNGLTFKDLGTDLNGAAEIIRAGGLVVISVDPGYFTDRGHLMVIRAISQDGTEFYLADPAGKGAQGDSETRAFSAAFLRSTGSMKHLWGYTK
jgi:hypothetical protein